MRRTIVIFSGALALLVSFIRVYDSPLFITNYTYLAQHAFTTHQQFIHNVLLLLVFYILFIAILRKHDFPDESLYVLLATPAVITALVFADISLYLGILGILALLFWNNQYVLAAVTVSAVILWPPAIVMAIIPLVTLALRKNILSFTATLFAVIAITLRAPPIISLSAGFAELGQIGATSVFILLLGITGLVLLWNKHNYPYAFAATVLAGMSMLFFETRLIVAILFALAGGYALNKLADQDWNLENIRNVSILLVACGLVFSALVTIGDATRASPTDDAQDLLRFLSHIDESVFVLAEHRPFLSWNDVAIAQTDYDTIMASRNIDEVKELIPRYVLLHANDDAPNLRFLIAFTDDFSIAYTNDEWSVWEFHS